MHMKRSDSLLEDSPDAPALVSDDTAERLITAAFKFLPDAVYLFGDDRRLLNN